MYAMTCTRSDILHLVIVVSRYIVNLSKVHWLTLKLILRYLRSTIVGTVSGTVTCYLVIRCLP
jgi:hypothetical protein